MRKFSISAFPLFNISLDVVLTFEFCRDITIWKMTIFDKVDYVEMESALSYSTLYWVVNRHSEFNWEACMGISSKYQSEESSNVSMLVGAVQEIHDIHLYYCRSMRFALIHSINSQVETGLYRSTSLLILTNHNTLYALANQVTPHINQSANQVVVAHRPANQPSNSCTCILTWIVSSSA